MTGPCAKQVVTATIVTPLGERFVGANHCDEPQQVCPRAEMPTGVGYELCRSICRQSGHAEINALKMAGEASRGATLYLDGHTYACEPCKAACTAAGIVAIMIGSPPHPERPEMTPNDLARISLEELATLESVWRQARENHERYSATGSHEDDIRFMTLGMAGEAGEIVEAIILAALVNKATGKAANLVKKRWRDGDDHANELQKEVADVCAYAFMLAAYLGMEPQDLLDTIAFKQQVFVAKMEARARAQASGEE